ncbi:MAG: DUF2071 domain-containing protein [Acidimicrobiia bacterium]|nr:DUF2071 domain-containing protein [Acidimicrobiia bacterium]
MLQSWTRVAFAHWPVAPAAVQATLPPGLEVDTFGGDAWIGLVAFDMRRIRLPGMPAVPYFGSFPETNVRTYVTDASGRPGVWFYSLDITRLAPVAVARLGYRLPYMWSQMDIAEDLDLITYTARRRWPRAESAHSEFGICRGAPLVENEVGHLERFLTARWGLYTMLGSLAYAPVDHPAWPLQHARLCRLDDGLVAAAGFEGLTRHEPLMHYSPGVDVRIGLPKRLDS